MSPLLRFWRNIREVKAPRQTRTSRRPTTRFHPHLETLEARETPAGGIVDVTFAAGSVKLVGDDANNIIFIVTDSDGRLKIDDDLSGQTRFRLNGGDPRSNVTLPAAVTGGITIRMGDGNDTLGLGSVDVPGSMRVQGGEGDNHILVQGVLNVGSHLSVTNGSGQDEMNITGRLEVDGKVSINNRAGGSTLYSGGFASIKVGSLSVTDGEGFDRADLLGEVNVLSNLSIKHGAGGSLLQGGTSTAISVGGAMSITSGEGVDTISLGDANSLKAGAISIRQGPGNSDMTLASTSGLNVARNLVIVGGPEFDHIQLGKNTSAVTVGGSVHFNLGKGGSKVDVFGSTLTVDGRIGVSAGRGQDYVTIDSNQSGPVGSGVDIRLGLGESQSVDISGLSIAGGLRVSTADNTPGSGSDSVALNWVKVGLATVISSGAANDIINVSQCTFDGPFMLSTGAGKDSVGIESGNGNGSTRFNGKVTVRTGDGNDSVYVGGDTVETWAEFAAATFWDGGPGTSDQIIIKGHNLFNGPEPVIVGFEP